MARFLAFVVGTIFALTAPPAQAEVVATFYSHDFGNHFPHAFVSLKGKVDSTGEMVDTNYGFTAASLSPAILMGPVKGVIESQNAKYVASSNAHFSIRLSDSDYQRMMALVDKWRMMPGKNYNLSKRNCVHFAMEAAALLGVTVNRSSKFFKKPRTFLLEVMRLNPGLKL